MIKMCGIVGMTSRKTFTSHDIISMLKKLEYRGYDSAGIAITGNGMYIEKSVGRISELENKLKSFTGNTAISQTRWAKIGRAHV